MANQTYPIAIIGTNSLGQNFFRVKIINADSFKTRDYRVFVGPDFDSTKVEKSIGSSQRDPSSIGGSCTVTLQLLDFTRNDIPKTQEEKYEPKIVGAFVIVNYSSISTWQSDGLSLNNWEKSLSVASNLHSTILLVNGSHKNIGFDKNFNGKCDQICQHYSFKCWFDITNHLDITGQHANGELKLPFDKMIEFCQENSISTKTSTTAEAPTTEMPTNPEPKSDDPGKSVALKIFMTDIYRIYQTHDGVVKKIDNYLLSMLFEPNCESICKAIGSNKPLRDTILQMRDLIEDEKKDEAVKLKQIHKWLMNYGDFLYF